MNRFAKASAKPPSLRVNKRVAARLLAANQQLQLLQQSYQQLLGLAAEGLGLDPDEGWAYDPATGLFSRVAPPANVTPIKTEADEVASGD